MARSVELVRARLLFLLAIPACKEAAPPEAPVTPAGERPVTATTEPAPTPEPAKEHACKLDESHEWLCGTRAAKAASCPKTAERLDVIKDKSVASDVTVYPHGALLKEFA